MTRTVLVISDVHVPYHDPVALDVCYAAIKATRPTDIVIIGDFIDGYPISRFPKSPDRRADLKFEVDAANAELDRLQAISGRATIHYCAGNHEARLEHFIARSAPELFGLVSIKNLLDIPRRGMHWVPYGKHFNIGKIAYAHDIGRSGKHAVAQSLADFGHSLVFGHTHRLGVVYAGTVRGERHVACSVGWLGSYEKIDYRNQAMARREWSHGFGFVNYLSNGVGYVQGIPIIDGKCIVDGRRISVKASKGPRA